MTSSETLAFLTSDSLLGFFEIRGFHFGNRLFDSIEDSSQLKDWRFFS